MFNVDHFMSLTETEATGAIISPLQIFDTYPTLPSTLPLYVGSAMLQHENDLRSCLDIIFISQALMIYALSDMYLLLPKH